MPYCLNCDNASQFIYECHTHELVTFDELGRLSNQNVLASTTLKVRCYQCNSEEIEMANPPQGQISQDEERG